MLIYFRIIKHVCLYLSVYKFDGILAVIQSNTHLAGIALNRLELNFQWEFWLILYIFSTLFQSSEKLHHWVDDLRNIH